MAIFRRGPPNGGASNAGLVGTDRDFGRIAGCRSMSGGVRTPTATTVDGAVYHTDRHARVNLVYHNQHGRPRRREENNREQN